VLGFVAQPILNQALKALYILRRNPTNNFK
jgi:hypothetical protein